MDEVTQGEAVESDENLVVLPEPVEEALVGWLDENLMVPAVAYRTEIAKDDEWPWLRTLTEGNPWDDPAKMTAPADFEPFHVPIVKPTLDTVKGIALQSPSIIEFSAMSADDEDFAADLTKIVGDYLWGVRKARSKLGLAFFEGGIIGTAWSHTFWDTRLADGQGDPDFTILPAEEVWLDPSATSVEDAGYLIHASRRPVLEVKYSELYNDRRGLVQSDEAVNEGHDTDTPKSQIPLVTVKHFWVRGVYLAALRAEVEGLDTHLDQSWDKYGVLIVVANNYVLKIVGHPWECERLPYQKFVYYMPTGNQRIYGTGEAKLLEDIAMATDARVTQLLNQSALISNEQWVVSSLAMVDEDELTNRPGQVIHVDGPPDLIKRVAPGGISGALFNTVDMMLRFTEIVSGMYQVNRGDTPGSLRAGVAIQALQRGGEGRTRQKMDNFDDFVADIAIGLVDIMAKMYDGERVFRITGSTMDALAPEAQPEGSLTPEDAEYAGSELAAMPEQAPAVPASRNVTLSSKDFFRDGKRVILDARAVVGMQLRSREDQIQADVELMGAGVFDAQYVIENNNFRDKARLLQRLFAVAQSQAAEQAAGAPEPGMMEPPQVMEDEGMTPDEQDQIQQSIEMLLSKMQQLEEQGALPEGMTAQAAQMVQQEIANGGTGEQALAQVLQQVQTYMQQGGSSPEFGIAPSMGGL